MTAVFLSYSSEQADAATRIALSLKEDGHSVFRDRSSLPPGEGFDARIRAALEESDLFVFLISRASVSPGRYTLTELKFAEQKWAHPAGHVLPVEVEPVPKDALPAYLRAVTILTPQGNLTAEVAAAVALMSAPWWRRMLQPKRLVPMLVAVLIAAGAAWIGLPSYLERREQNAKAETLMKQSRAQREVGKYEDAWKLLEQASAVAPASVPVFEAQEDLAMELVRYTGLSSWESSSSFEKLLNRTLPVLSRGTSGAKGERLADLVAHMGWADYLRERTGVGNPHPDERYRRALEVDSRNVYAHAFWGFELLRLGSSAERIAGAKRHFSAAVESGRERDYVRWVQVTALLRAHTNMGIDNLDRIKEAIRVANEMRINGEKRPTGWGPRSLKRMLWQPYRRAALDYSPWQPLLAALPPAEHLALFGWLFPEDDPPENPGTWLFDRFSALAHMQEYGGDRAGALVSYRRVLSIKAEKGYNASSAIQIADDADAAIKRLSK